MAPTSSRRVGTKDRHLGTLRPTTCRGKVRVRLPSSGHIGVLAWQTYTLLGFNPHATFLVASGAATLIGCGGVAKVMVTAIGAVVRGASEGVAFPIISTAAGAFGCGVGAQHLVNLIPDGPSTLNGARMVK